MRLTLQDVLSSRSGTSESSGKPAPTADGRALIRDPQQRKSHKLSNRCHRLIVTASELGLKSYRELFHNHDPRSKQLFATWGLSVGWNIYPFRSCLRFPSLIQSFRKTRDISG